MTPLLTRSDWLTCVEPQRLLAAAVAVPAVLTARKRALVASAYVRTFYPAGTLAEILALNDRYADGEVPWSAVGRLIYEWQALSESPVTHGAILALCDSVGWPQNMFVVGSALAAAATRLRGVGLIRDILAGPFRPQPECHRCHDRGTRRGRKGRRKSCPCCEGSGFFTPWLTCDGARLALAAYQSQDERGWLDAARLAVLADALEEGGCADQVMLDHLRGLDVCQGCLGSGREEEDGAGFVYEIVCRECKGAGKAPCSSPHFRGCWALDWALQRR